MYVSGPPMTHHGGVCAVSSPPPSFHAHYDLSSWIRCPLRQNGPYTWTIVSDPLRAFLFVLVRDPEGFTGSQEETDLLAKCKELGFTSPWNSPRKTVQAGCSYPEKAVETISHPEKSDALSSVLNLRGGAFGCLPPLHASCQVSAWIKSSQESPKRVTRKRMILCSLLALTSNTMVPFVLNDLAQMTFDFSENSCAEVSDALVSSAEGMMGFDSCNGGNK